MIYLDSQGGASIVQRQRVGPEIITTRVRILAWDCFVFDIASLSLKVARPIQPTLCTKVAIKHHSSSDSKNNMQQSYYSPWMHCLNNYTSKTCFFPICIALAKYILLLDTLPNFYIITFTNNLTLHLGILSQNDNISHDLTKLALNTSLWLVI